MYYRLSGNQIEEKNKVILAATFMRGKVLSWINTSLQEYMDGDANKETTAWIEKFSLFKERIRYIFGLANEESIAESII